jgi:hypothetical protein
VDLSFSTLFAGLVFWAFGGYLIKYGKGKAHLPSILIGIALLVFPFFVDNPYLLWGTGLGLLFLAYRLARDA